MWTHPLTRGLHLCAPAASEFCRKCGKSTTVDGLPVVDEEALVSAVTEAMYGRMNGHGHHMQGGLKPAMATFRGLPADLLVSFCEARPDMWHASKLKVVKRTVYFHTGVVAAKEETDMELPTGYYVGPSDPKAWPFLTVFDDPKVYAMRELHALCEAHFMHPMDDSDALRDVMGWDSAHQPRHRFP
eukprot:jgi/Tetstr1/456153/TSEL_042921.t1